MPESDNMRILVVSPYEGFSEAVSSVVSKAEGLSVTYLSGDLGEGVEAARAVIETGFDVIMSRGGTSELLEAAFPLPVCKCGSLRLRFRTSHKAGSGQFGKGGNSRLFQDNRRRLRRMRALTTSDLEIFTVGDEHEVGPHTVDRLMREGYSVIIGDNVTVRAARRRGMNGILVTSGRESVLKAAGRGHEDLCLPSP